MFKEWGITMQRANSGAQESLKRAKLILAQLIAKANTDITEKNQEIARCNETITANVLQIEQLKTENKKLKQNEQTMQLLQEKPWIKTASLNATEQICMLRKTH